MHLHALGGKIEDEKHVLQSERGVNRVKKELFYLLENRQKIAVFLPVFRSFLENRRKILKIFGKLHIARCKKSR